MTESEFHDQVDDTLIAIEDALEDTGLDLDFDNSGGILTVTFPDRSKIIINRQTPVRQLWIAARSGGFHLDHDADHRWVLDSNGEPLILLLNRLCSEQAGETVSLELP